VKKLEERVAKAGGDALRLGEKLRLGQEHSVSVERVRRQLEMQVRQRRKGQEALRR